jgi:hypothetical protein
MKKRNIYPPNVTDEQIKALEDEIGHNFTVYSANRTDIQNVGGHTVDDVDGAIRAIKRYANACFPGHYKITHDSVTRGSGRNVKILKVTGDIVYIKE